MNITIQNLKEFLITFKSKNTLIKQSGFIESHLEMNNLNYEIEYEFLKIFDKNSENFITINLNQIYNTIYEQEKSTLYLDNDTIITLEIKR